MLRIYGADAERQDFPVPTRVDHPNVQTFKVQVIPENMRRFPGTGAVMPQPVKSLARRRWLADELMIG